MQEEFGAQFKCQLCDLEPIPSLAFRDPSVDVNEDLNKMMPVMIFGTTVPTNTCVLNK